MNILIERLAYILMYISIFSCGQNVPQVFSINGFETYYNNFVLVTGHSSNNLIISLGNASQACNGPITTIGCCVMQYNIPPSVTIDSNYWNNALEEDRQELIDHELGHCVLGRVHRLVMLPNGYPASIMYPYHFSPQVIDNNSQYYYNELVNGG